MEHGLFSVVTPSYNEVHFLADTLRSVRRQDHPHVEHWVIDGGSSDGTVELLEEFDKKASGDEGYDLKWISEPDKGQSHAINKGFERADGDYIGWLNSDDMYFETQTLRFVEKSFREQDAKIIYGDNALVDSENKLLRIDHKYDYSRARLLRSCYICQPALFFHNEVLSEHRLDESLEYVMDYEFWLRLSEAYDFHHVDRILAADRNHAERKMLTNRKSLIPEREKIQRRHGQSFGWKYWMGRLGDKLYSAINRLRGALTVVNIMQRTLFAFPLHLHDYRSLLQRQLFAKNRELV